MVVPVTSRITDCGARAHPYTSASLTLLKPSKGQTTAHRYPTLAPQSSTKMTPGFDMGNDELTDDSDPDTDRFGGDNLSGDGYSGGGSGRAYAYPPHTHAAAT
ncbi:unnamed protein product, partial [Laminaria digitata]